MVLFGAELISFPAAAVGLGFGSVLNRADSTGMSELSLSRGCTQPGPFLLLTLTREELGGTARIPADHSLWHHPQHIKLGEKEEGKAF